MKWKLLLLSVLLCIFALFWFNAVFRWPFPPSGIPWQLSSMHLAISWATFCASVLHMSDLAIVRIHVIAVWFIIGVSTLFILLFGGRFRGGAPG